MEKEQTTEERTKMVMEYLTQIYFDKGTIDTKQLFSIALYLYQNANLGPRGTKKVARYLVKLSDITKDYAIDNLVDDYDIEEVKEKEVKGKIESIYQRINKCLDRKKIGQYVLANAKKTLECANKTVVSRNFVLYSVYHDIFFHYCAQLRLDCQQKEYSMIYLRTRVLLELLDLNKIQKENNISAAMNAKARLEVLMHLSKNPKKIISLSEMISALDFALKEVQYQKMQEETIYANAAFAQATRSSSYQKQISRQIEDLDRQGNV